MLMLDRNLCGVSTVLQARPIFLHAQAVAETFLLTNMAGSHETILCIEQNTIMIVCVCVCVVVLSVGGVQKQEGQRVRCTGRTK